MIPDITEVNFPSYATLHQASISFADMGDRTITTQVKIDGDIAPEFIGTNGEDWEVTFKGERFIHPLRKPQATKNNESRYSLIDMTFYHWAEYQMKRYYFVSLANIDSSTAIADKYVVPMNLNLQDFARAIDDVLAYYFPDGELYVYKSGGSYIYPDLQDYDPQVKAVEISYTYIWDLLQKTQELYNCRWAIEQDGNGNYAIKFGYPVTELSHVFKYGYEDGLLSLERQVQDANIRNQILGRGGEKNLPRLYFKDYEKFHPNSTDSAYSNYGQIPDPDAIPELENIYFSELRDSNFRSYVQGWKTNPHRQLTTPDGWVGTVETYDSSRGATDWAYKKGHEDETFDPVEYVKDDDSIATYGLLQGGLEDQEDIYPSIQGMEIELPCDKGAHDSLAAGHEVETLADEVVSVDPVLTDEISAGDSIISQDVREVQFPTKKYTPGVTRHEFTQSESQWAAGAIANEEQSFSFYIPEGYVAYVDLEPLVTAYIDFERTSASNSKTIKEHLRYDVSESHDCADAVNIQLNSWGVYTSDGDRVTKRTLPSGRYVVKVNYRVPPVTFHRVYYVNNRRPSQSSSVPSTSSTTAPRTISLLDRIYWAVTPSISYTLIPFNGTLVLNENATASDTIAAGTKKEFSIEGDNFTVSGDGALVVEVPVTVTPLEYALVETKIHIINANTSQEVPNSNIPAGTYRLFVDVTVRNLDSDNSHFFTVKLDDTYIYNVQQNAQWQPTFDIWIKNIFNTDRTQFDGGEAGDDQYVASVWEPLRTTEEMAITFISGNLSYSSDWEFKIASGGIHYDNSRIISVEDENHIAHDIRSEWRLTLIKSEAEADAIHTYVPYKGFNAVAGDRFFLTGIYLPWAYVYAAERELTQKKEEELDKTKEVQPTWVVNLDKIRIQTLVGTETAKLVDSIHPGDLVRVKDNRFTDADGVQLYVSSITYNWQGNGEIIPEVEIVLSDQLQTSVSAVEQIRSDVQVVSNQIKSLSNIERTIRRIGDAAYLRKDGVQEESSSPTIFRREIRSAGFVAGLVGGEGWSMYMDPDGKSILEVDQLVVRDDMRINNLVANQVTAMGGKEILSAAAMKVSRVELDDSVGGGYICYFEQHEATIGNLFVVGDIAMSQTFDADNQQIRYYRRTVTAIGDGYIVLSDDNTNVGNANPQAGDTIVQFGHISNAARQFAIIRDVIGGGYEQMLSGLNSVSATGNEYYFAGAKDNSGTLSPRWFVGNASGEYAEWVNGELTIKGNIVVKRSSGVYSDISYLANAMPEDANASVTTIAGGMVLSSIIGVQDNGDLVAGLNASTLGRDNTHGTLMVFAGATDASSIASAPFRVYEDGHVEATDMVLKTGCEIGSFNIVTTEYTAMTLTELIATHAAESDWAPYNFKTRLSHIALTSDIYITEGTSTGSANVRVGMPYDNPYQTVYLPLIEINNNRTAHARISEPVNGGIWVKCNATSSSMSTMGINVVCSGSGAEHVGISVSASGASTNYGIRCVNGMFAGFRPNIRTLSSAGTYNDYDNIIICANTSSITQYLPSSPQKGQMYIVFHTTTSSLTINGNGKNIARAYGDGTSSGTTSLSVRQTVWLFYDGSKWVTNYLSH